MTRAAEDTRTAADFEASPPNPMNPKGVTALGYGDIARMTHEMNRLYCESLGDHSQKPWDDAEQWQRDSAINGVTAVLTGRSKTPEEQHLSWAEQKFAEGWVYGEVKDAAAKTHPCLVDYKDLPPDQRRKDHLFRAIVQALTEEV